MATLFIFISFILNAVALFAIILLFMRQNRLHEIKKEQEKLVADMEEMMTAYLAEMKEENEKLIKEFSSSSPAEHSAAAGQASSAVTPGKSAPPSRTPEGAGAIAAPSMQRIRAAQVYNRTANKTADENEKISAEEQEAPAAAQALADEIVSLKDQGLSVEEIARKLNKGKTEVELALKFADAGKNS
ncbi:hypothetical protein [Pseudobacillus badius]|uniref:hypothetical protein n=1 Tax=Bacillus badius TaxID=1455 RepID=UPI001CBB9104|nr:hypothetical protein [Bacillus badius]MED0667346.1 hypothetical protein [Bacillus badius]UAT31842.1 hypothetical protein K7T73_06350 [Bacillus badius]GLY10462.1 swarming motility protein SwrB [Bacillus badius]